MLKRVGARHICLLTLLVFLLGYNLAVAQKERQLSAGKRVVLALRPADPRSLLQGDYMTLNFALSADIARALDKDAPGHGLAVLERRADGVDVFARLHAGEEPAAGETLLEFRRVRRGIEISGGAFFFEEGQGSVYAPARYAELRVDTEGRALIRALLDDDKKELGLDRKE